MNDGLDVPLAPPWPDAVSEPVLSRRELILASAGVVVALLPLPAFAASTPGVQRFLALSKALTGHADLDAVTASRLLAVLTETLPGFAQQADRLAALAQGAASPDDVLARADGAGLKDVTLVLVAAWYTGSIADRMNAPMVSYHDALMYRTVADALPAPTYCFNGPAWWTAVPPLDISPPGAQPAAGSPSAGVLHPSSQQKSP